MSTSRPAPPPGDGSTSSLSSPTTPATSQTQTSGRHDGQQSSPLLVAQDQQLTPAAESWIEVSSHPSSSSVSSIGDEIVTTGLQVRNAYAARRKRLHPRYYTHLTSPQEQQQQRRQQQQQLVQEQQQQRQQQQQQQQQPRTVTNTIAAGSSSSQDEYDESDSEEDRVLTSSSENINNTSAPLKNTPAVEPISSSDDDDDDDDDDDHATALGRRPSEPFRPQPNAFSHPPSHLAHRHSASAIPAHHPRPSFSQRSQTRTDQGASNFMTPADNDAALRASLTTLLSVAAAARGRTKGTDKSQGDRADTATGNQPVELRLIPESELLGDPHNSTPASQELQTAPRAPLQQPAAPRVSGEKAKRSATPPGRSPRNMKKKKTVTTTEDAYISPTMITWMVGASVVVLVSAVGFGAGYIIGREVGRQEALSSLSAGNASAMAEGGNCGREALRSSGGSLKRLRWGASVGKSVAV